MQVHRCHPSIPSMCRRVMIGGIFICVHLILHGFLQVGLTWLDVDLGGAEIVMTQQAGNDLHPNFFIGEVLGKGMTQDMRSEIGDPSILSVAL